MPAIVIVIILGLLGGIAVGLQGPLASMITERIGIMESIFIVHLGGALIIGVPLLLHGGGKIGQWHSLPWYTLLSGSLGLVVLFAISYTIPRVGVAATVTLIVAGQLVLATMLDHFGWLGTAERRLDPSRLIGIMVLFVGVWLIVRK